MLQQGATFNVDKAGGGSDGIRLFAVIGILLSVCAISQVCEYQPARIRGPLPANSRREQGCSHLECTPPIGCSLAAV